MDSKKGAITSDQMNVGMCLVLIHLREGGKKIMIVFRGGRVTMGGLGPMDEGHDESSGGKLVFGVGRGCSRQQLWDGLSLPKSGKSSLHFSFLNSFKGSSLKFWGWADLLHLPRR